MPADAAFYFDRELRTPQDRSELSRRCRGRIHFTRARMFENYLLVPQAVFAVLQRALVAAGLAADSVDLAAVSAKLSTDWTDVDGAKLLQSIFDEVSASQVQYEKVTHGAALLDEVLRMEPSRLQPLAEEIETALRAMSRSSSSSRL